MACMSGCRSGTISVRGDGLPVAADDGFLLTAYRFTQSPAPASRPRALVFYIQGSEDQTVTTAIGSLAAFCAMNAPVIAAERRGVASDGKVDAVIAARSAARQRRIADSITVLNWGLIGLPSDLPVVLLGASEGGDVAAAVAARCPRVTHVILLGSGGGWTQEEEFRHFIRTRGQCLDLKSEEDLDARVADIRAHPDADLRWAGHPYLRWSTYMFSRPADELLRVECPILVVHGTADDSVPVESARALRDAFIRAGKTNLTLAEIPGASHRFADAASGAPKLPLVEVEVVGWLGKQGALAPAEVEEYLRRVRHAHPSLFAAPDAR
jgi:pimeloyl-ACP methyl ester carboxylesterase